MYGEGRVYADLPIPTFRVERRFLIDPCVIYVLKAYLSLQDRERFESKLSSAARNLSKYSKSVTLGSKRDEKEVVITIAR